MCKSARPWAGRLASCRMVARLRLVGKPVFAADLLRAIFYCMVRCIASDTSQDACRRGTTLFGDNGRRSSVNVLFNPPSHELMLFGSLGFFPVPIPAGSREMVIQLALVAFIALFAFNGPAISKGMARHVAILAIIWDSTVRVEVRMVRVVVAIVSMVVIPAADGTHPKKI